MTFISSFLSNRRGNVLLITAAVILILLGVSGASVDFGRQAMIKARIQQAIDAAAIAIAAMPPTASDADRYATFTRYLTNNYSGNPARTQNSTTVDARVDQPPTAQHPHASQGPA